MPLYPVISEAERYAARIQTFVKFLLDARVARVAASRPLLPQADQSRVEFWLAQAGAWMARAGSRLTPEFPVLFSSSAAHYSTHRLIWKSIESLGRLGVIVNAVPRAPAVHILRRSCGHIASVLRGERAHQFVIQAPGSDDYGVFNAALASPLNRKYAQSAIDFRSLQPEERLAWSWVLLNEKVHDECSTKRVLRIFYEDVCLNPGGSVAKMFSFAGLEVKPKTEAFIAATTAGGGQSGYYGVFKDLLVLAVRWRSELGTPMIERILAIVQRSPFAVRYGRDPLQPSDPQ